MPCVEQAMIKLPKISIAAVNGMAVGGGVNMAFVWQDYVSLQQSSSSSNRARPKAETQNMERFF